MFRVATNEYYCIGSQKMEEKDIELERLRDDLTSSSAQELLTKSDLELVLKEKDLEIVRLKNLLQSVKQSAKKQVWSCVFVCCDVELSLSLPCLVSSCLDLTCLALPRLASSCCCLVVVLH
jgi:hypothetical protein